MSLSSSTLFWITSQGKIRNLFERSFSTLLFSAPVASPGSTSPGHTGLLQVWAWAALLPNRAPSGPLAPDRCPLRPSTLLVLLQVSAFLSPPRNTPQMPNPRTYGGVRVDTSHYHSLRFIQRTFYNSSPRTYLHRLRIPWMRSSEDRSSLFGATAAVPASRRRPGM